MQKGGLYNDKYTVPSERNARYVTHVTAGNIFEIAAVWAVSVSVSVRSPSERVDLVILKTKVF